MRASDKLAACHTAKFEVEGFGATGSKPMSAITNKLNLATSQGIARCDIIGQPSVFSKAAMSSSSVSTAI